MLKKLRKTRRDFLVSTVLSVAAFYQCKPRKADSSKKKLSSRDIYAAFFKDDTRRLFNVLAGPILGRKLEASQLYQLMGNIYATFDLLPPNTREDIDRLCQVLNVSICQYLLIEDLAVFGELTFEERESVIHHWQRSRFSIMRQGLQAIQVLVNASYYAYEKNWQQIGYGGPPAFYSAFKATNIGTH